MVKYHLIGIKGSGMSALAQVLFDMGHQVQGSDVETRFFTQKPLEDKGIPILPFSSANIERNMCVIASPAFGDDHEEIERCRSMGIPVYRYFEFLGKLAQDFVSIAVSGSHGKTSTTGLLAHVFKQIRPTSYIIGDGTGYGQQNSHYFAFEACEYRRHFLAYQPDYAIITNIDYDHPDYFRNLEDVIDAFQSLADQVNKHIVACGDDPNLSRIQTTIPVLTYGFKENNDLRAKNVQASPEGLFFDVVYEGQTFSRFLIPLHGEHNVLNALSVIGISFLEGIAPEMIKTSMRTFRGVKRRFSEKEWTAQNILIDDYAHHPVEIKATIEAVRSKYPHKKLVSIFQPHTYTRTKMFLDDFAASLNEADQVYLCDIFGSARENTGDLTITDLMEKIPSARFMNEQNVHELEQYSNAILLFMGAGDIQKVQQAFENGYKIS